MSDPDWSFADAVTVLGYYVITVWLLGAIFQLGMNIVRRCMSCRVRSLFVGSLVVIFVLMGLSLFYLLFKRNNEDELVEEPEDSEPGSASSSSGGGNDNNLRDFMVGLVCAEFTLVFLMIRGAIKAGDTATRTEDGQIRVTYVSILNGVATVPASDARSRRDPNFTELALPSYEEAVRSKQSFRRGISTASSNIINNNNGKRSRWRLRQNRRDSNDVDNEVGQDLTEEDDGDFSDSESQSSDGSVGSRSPPPFEQALHL